MKTAMQELKEKFQTGALSPLEFTMWFSANMWRLLDEEKKQMVDFAIGAYQDISKMKGVPENLISENKILFEEYYNNTNAKAIINTQTPIELPNDEEIRENADKYTIDKNTYYSFINGAKWMKEQILNQNK